MIELLTRVSVLVMTRVYILLTRAYIHWLICDRVTDTCLSFSYDTCLYITDTCIYTDLSVVELLTRVSVLVMIRVYMLLTRAYIYWLICGRVTDTCLSFSYDTCLYITDTCLYIVTYLWWSYWHVSQFYLWHVSIYYWHVPIYTDLSVVELLARVSVLGTDTCRYVSDTCLCVSWWRVYMI